MRNQYTLPVVFHIIHNGGPENITDDQVAEGLQHLNEAFANTGYYDPSAGATVGIDFCLASRRPDNTASTGIERVVSELTQFNYLVDDQTVKDLSRYDPSFYINIWVVDEICSNNGCGVAGYAYLPAAHGQPYDGIVVEADYVGGSPAASAVLVHEMGHYLGLYHTFEGGCANSDCQSTGDRVCDTPPDNTTARPPCGFAQNSCTSDTDDLSTNNPFRPVAQGGLGDQPDAHENYMDYSRLECYNQFSAGQADRMHAVVETIRSSLLSSLGCSDPCPVEVEAAFTLNSTVFSPGETLIASNASSNADGYEWYINGMLVSTDEHLTYPLSQLGVFTVELIALSDNPDCSPVSVQQLVEVACAVEADISPANTTLQPGGTVPFVNTTQNAEFFEWRVNGLVVSTAENYEFQATEPGVYTICLIAGDAYCQDEVCSTVQVINTVAVDSCAPTFALRLDFPVGDSDLRAVIPSADGNVYAAGGAGGDALIAKMTPDGDLLWARRFDFTNRPDKILSIHRDDEGMLYGVSYASAVGAPPLERGAVAFRYDVENDNMLWVNYFNDHGRFHRISINPLTGNYLAYGVYIRPVGVNDDAELVELDRSTGEVLWNREFHTGSSDYFADVVYRGQQMILTGRSTFSSSSGGMRPTLYSFDLDGNLDWSRFYLTPATQIARQYADAIELMEDGVVFTYFGPENSTNLNLSVGGLIKTTFEGEPVWRKKYELQGFDHFRLADMLSLADGFLLFGFGGSASDIKLVLIRTDLNGNALWCSSYESGAVFPHISNVGGPRLMQMNGFFYLAGALGDDGLLLKVRPDGGFNGDTPCILHQEVEVATLEDNSPYVGDNNMQEIDGDIYAPPALEGNAQVVQPEVIEVCSPPDCPDSCLVDFVTHLHQPRCEDGQLVLTVEVCNTETDSFTGSIPVAIYDAHPGQEAANLLDTLLIEAEGISDSSCVAREISFPLPEGALYAQVNDDGSFSTPFDPGEALATIILECDYFNNLDSLIFMPEPPEVDLGPDFTVCENSAIVLSAGGGFSSYRWADGSVDSVYTAYEPGTYWVEVTNECGVSASDTITVSMSDAVMVDIEPEVAFICPEDSAAISLTLAGDYSVQWYPDTGLSCSDCTELTAAPDTTTTYTVVATNADGCISADSVRVNLISCEQVIDTSLCANDSLLLFDKYFYPGQPDTVMVEDTLFLVEVEPVDTVLRFVDTLVCFGDSAVFDGVTIPGGAQEAFVYQFGSGCDSTVVVRVEERPRIVDTTFLQICEGDSASVFGQPRTAPGLYAEQFTAVSGCDSTHFIQLTVVDTPTVSVGPALLSCRDTTGRLQAEGQGGLSPYAFQWSDGSTEAVNDDLAPGIYELTLTDANGCQSTAQGEVLDSLPTLSFTLSADSVSCFGFADGSIAVGPVSGGTPPYIYSLDGLNYQSGPVFPGLEAAGYALYVQDSEGCQDTLATVVNAPLPLSLLLPPDTALILGESLPIDAQYAGNPQFFSWEPPNGLDCTGCPMPTASPLQTTRYFLTIGSSPGCTLTDDILVFIEKPRRLYIPNAFSPNGDGVNDFFRLYAGPEVERILRIRIFDRWGEQVFEGENYSPDEQQPAWDGRFRGEAMQPAVFAYVVEALFIDGEVIQFSGDLQLLR